MPSSHTTSRRYNGSTVTETRTVVDSRGRRRTETRTYTRDYDDDNPIVDEKGYYSNQEDVRQKLSSRNAGSEFKFGLGDRWNKESFLSTSAALVDNSRRRSSTIRITDATSGIRKESKSRVRIDPQGESNTKDLTEEPEELSIEPRYKQGWAKRRKSSLPPINGVAPSLEGSEKFNRLKAECAAKRRLFEDRDFPAVDQSVFYSKAPDQEIIWKRPTEIVDDPHLFVDSASRFDIQQGELGNCWFLAAVACLCEYESLLRRVIPRDQSYRHDYWGIFHFQFWYFGAWVDVIIDDRLPTDGQRLLFMHSPETNEFWSALLEKAYAKLNGSYESLKGGTTSEALEDFTGGVAEMYDLRDPPPKLFDIMLKAHKRESMMACSIETQSDKVEGQLSNGLIEGHAFSVTDIRTIKLQRSRKGEAVQLVRVRNPWGNEVEWNGAWSDYSREWSLISDDDKREINLTYDNDGEFWMSFEDFASNFQKLEICNLSPDSLAEDTMRGSVKKKWETNVLEGSWKRRVNAGGCLNYPETFWTNPQYQVEVVDADDDHDDDTGTILVALMQKERRKKRMEGLELLTIGYAVYKAPPATTTLKLKFFQYNSPVTDAPEFINAREVCGRHKLPPGTYCIVVSTYDPNEEGDFLLRIFSEKPNYSSEVDTETAQNVDLIRLPVTQDKARERALRDAFLAVTGDSEQLDAYELRRILNAAFGKEFDFEGFSADTCRSMLANVDTDRDGRLEFEEFKILWNDMRLWKNVFKKFDKDQNGNFNGFELREALRSIGYDVSNATFNALVMRYSHNDGKIYFDDFIHLICRLKTMFDVFNEIQSNGQAAFGLDQFIQTTMYA